MDTHARFIIFQMIAAFCVTCRPVKIGALVSFTAKARGFVIFGTIDISTVIESTITPSNWSTASLVLKMPMKTGERSMLLTLMLQKERTLIHTKLFEILVMKDRFGAVDLSKTTKRLISRILVMISISV